MAHPVPDRQSPQPPAAQSHALAAALTNAALVTLCQDCVDAHGLCHTHAPHVLPGLARPAWLRLIGFALIEQSRLQRRAIEHANHAPSASDRRKAQRRLDAFLARQAKRARRQRQLLALVAA